MSIIKSLWNSIRIGYRNLKIGNKLMMMFFAAFLIPFIFVAFFGYGMLEEELIKTQNRELENEVSQVEQYIENRLDNYLTLASTILLDTKLQFYIQEEHNRESYLEAYDYIEERFDSILSLNPGVDSVSIYVSNKSLPSDHVLVQYIEPDAMKYSWYSNFLVNKDGAYLFLPPHLKKGREQRNKELGEYYVFTVLQQLSYTISKYGDTIIRLDIRKNELDSFLKQYGNEKYLYILDAEDTIIFATDEDLLQKSIFSLYNLEQPLSGERGSVSGHRGESKVVTRYQRLKNEWKIVAVTTHEHLFKKSTVKLIQIALIYTVLLILAVGLFYATSRIWTRRILTMTSMMKQLEGGDFNVSTHMEGGDEFDEMIRSFSKMSYKIGHLIQEVYIKELSKKAAELNNLQYLMNPHFLYNALSSISALAKKNTDHEVCHMANRLARFYRLSLSKGKNVITIREEIALTQYYLEIQKVRYGDKISVVFDLREELMDRQTLKVILQPFIENSIHHGIWDQDRTLHIVVRLTMEESTVCFYIIDDGKGFDTEIYKKSRGKLIEGNETIEKNEVKAPLGSGYGIINVDERIKLVYGEEYGVNIFSRLGIGTSVRVTIPAGQSGASKELPDII